MTELTTFAASSAVGAEEEATVPEPSEPTAGVLHATVEIGPGLDDGAA